MAGNSDDSLELSYNCIGVLWLKSHHRRGMNRRTEEAMITSLVDSTLGFSCNTRNNLTRIAGRLFKKDYDAVLHENASRIGLCDLVSASLSLNAAAFAEIMDLHGINGIIGGMDNHGLFACSLVLFVPFLFAQWRGA